MQEFLKSQLEIQEEALRYTIQEIQDNIGQVLSLVKLQLNTLSAAPPDQNRDALETSKQLVSKAISDLRGLSKTLDPDLVGHTGFEDRVRHEIQMLEKSTALQARLRINGSVYKLHIEQQTFLLRILQEAFSNILKHSGATNVQVVLDYEPLLFTLTIADDGRGFDLKNKKLPQNGSGLKMMARRIHLLKGRFELQSGVSKGTSITIILPISRTARPGE